MGLGHQVFFAVIVIFGSFHFEDDLSHGLHDECGMLAGGCLGAEHDGIGAFEDGVGDVGDFAAVWFHPVDHAFHHLRGDDNGFGAVDTFADDLALGHRDLFDGQFYAQVAAGDHDGVGLVDDIPQVFHRGGHFDFGDHFCLAFLIGQAFLEVDDIFCLADKGQGDPVEFLLDDEFQVDDVLFRHGRKGDIRCRGG